MRTLLKRQIKKYLPEKYQNNLELKDFFEAVERSYINAEDQINLVQRASIISFEELNESNSKLEQETIRQSQIIDKLNNLIHQIQKFTQEEVDVSKNFDTIKLVDFIDHQTKKIIDLNIEKESLLKHLEQQNTELNNYITMVSHDLKSPLNIIHTLSNWVQNDAEATLNKQGDEYLNQIKLNVEKMDNLLNAILTYSTLKVEKPKTKVNITAIVTNIIEDFQNSNTIQLEILHPLPAIKKDQKSLHLLFKSLIENSIVHNTSKIKKIKIDVTNKTHTYYFSISDNAIAIDEKYYQKIFKAFQKLDASSIRSGFGLTLSKKIIDLYGGKIWMEPNYPKGNKINFTIPKNE